VATKFGTKAELLDLSKRAKELGIGILFDAVLNHKAGADHTERCKVIEVDNDGATLPTPVCDDQQGQLTAF
jgi:alpha-amylase